MPFDKPTRNLLARAVAACRDRLAADTSDQLQSVFGIYPDGSTLEVARSAEEQRAAEELAELLDYYASSGGQSRAAAYQRLVREIGFTTLNRLAALRLCEERGLVIECVRRGMESDGFRLYDRLAGGALGGRYAAYRAFLEGLYDELALDLGVLFDRHSPLSRVFPGEAALSEVLAQLTGRELEARQVWQQDETIGWVYQYYNDPAERKKMRDESQAPRNSRELAVRNQFFTPRYVVEFLTDNTLGRTWYEMRRGETELAEQCRYLVRRRRPVFLGPGEQPPRLYAPDIYPLSDPDLPGEMWVPPDPALEHVYDIFNYALTVGGYDYARRHLGVECADLANQRWKQYAQDGKWQGSFEELRCCLFFEQRRWRHFDEDPDEPARQGLLALYRALCERWELEVEFILHRPKKDPRDLRILDPACGSGHFLLYAFDLLETIYAEAWADPDLPPREASGAWLANDYSSLEDLRRAVPGLILRHNLHGIEIDPRAAQIAALALWLRAQRAYQGLGLKPAERLPIQKSNIVVAEPMPGDVIMREEFLATVQQPFIRYLMETVFEKMELAGEAGSLLKIEDDIRDPIRQAKQQWLMQSKTEQLALWPEARYPKADQLSLFDISGISDGTFWDRAEEMVLGTLRQYTRMAHNGKGVRRRLFVHDTEDGFAFIDLFQKQYDVILMNPPFGAFSKKSKGKITNLYPDTKSDIFSAFVERGIEQVIKNGYLGAITSRTGFFLGTFKDWREKVLLGKNQLITFADLGRDVLDDAVVEVACYVLRCKQCQNEGAYFLRLLIENDKEKELQSVISFGGERLFIVNPITFSKIESSPFAYWINDHTSEVFNRHDTFEPTVGDVRCGLSTNDNPRFVRTFWEISPENFNFVYYPVEGEKGFCRFDDPIVQAFFSRRSKGERIWNPHVMSGAAQPWFSPMTALVNWKDGGSEIKAYARVLGNSPSRNVRSESYYFRPGISWTRRAVRMIPYVIPGNSIPTASRYMAFPKSGLEKVALYGISSNVASAYLRIFGGTFEWPNFLVDNLKSLPWPTELNSFRQDFEDVVEKEIRLRRELYRGFEPYQEFTLPFTLQNQFIDESGAFQYETLLGYELEAKVASAYGFALSEFKNLERDLQEAVSVRVKGKNTKSEFDERKNEVENDEEETDVLDYSKRSEHESNISYSLGCSFGRWDIRIAIQPLLVPKFGDPFAPISVCPPGMLVGTNGLPAQASNVVSDAWLRARPEAITLPVLTEDGKVLLDGQEYPATIPDREYPLAVQWDGILVDDPGLDGKTPHAADIVRRTEDALRLLWPETYDSIEAEACEILEVKDLREYFRKPGGFFADHLKHYSKSRRQAPIYWPLSTPSGSYTLWLYYHRLSDDILYTAVNRYVEPKIAQVERAVQAIAERLNAPLSGPLKGRGGDLRELHDAQRFFLAELCAFRDELLRIAALPYKPDLNDGVIINAAPFHKLFRLGKWAKDTQATWKKLEQGEYDWAHMAYVLWPERVRGKCREDQSLAIAHGLEEVYVEKEGGKKRKKREAEQEEMEI